ncbi:MAG TPA: hypothetical protein VHE30_15565 [Polyangiaceae bacterium]|nr:hypothetical protein [Polyangiaceae bacterium]
MTAPLLSLVVVVYDMPEQAARTLHTLSARYQRGVAENDYEIVVVENASPRLLGEERARAAGGNVRYFLRDTDERSPVFAVNFGANQARGATLGVLVDGARLLTPGVVRLALLVGRAAPGAVLSVPGYHLGSELQQKSVDSGYDLATESALLQRIRFPEDGYRLFEIACFSGSCAAGFFLPYAESNCVVVPRRLFEELGGYDEGFVRAGGGYSNLDFYRRVLERDDVTLFVTPGEGTFHQLHGGITTGGTRGKEREDLMASFVEEYRAVRGVPYEVPKRRGMLLGEIPESARRFVVESAEKWAARS